MRKHIVRLTPLIALVVLLLTPGMAMAGQYMMINDSIDMPQPGGGGIVEKHAEVCTAFMKVLEASPPFPPMACEVKFPAGFPDFKVPVWQSVDVWENRDIWIQLGRAQPKDKEEEVRRFAYLRQRINENTVHFSSAQFDIDNDGNLEWVLRINTNICDPARKDTHGALHQNYPMYTVYNPATRKVDLSKANFYSSYWNHYASLFSFKSTSYYISLLADTTRQPYFGKLESHDERGSLPTKYYIKIFKPLMIDQGLRTAWKQPAALGCEYLYLPTNHEGGY